MSQTPEPRTGTTSVPATDQPDASLDPSRDAGADQTRGGLPHASDDTRASDPSDDGASHVSHDGASHVSHDGASHVSDDGGAPDDRGASDAARHALNAVRAEVAKAVVGQDAAVSAAIVALLAGGHLLLEGVPGVGKTLLVRSLAAALDLTTKRVQFTPDLMPGDLTGSLVLDPGTSDFTFREGPVFTNLLLADEINRTPPKTQSAMLEAMEERQVSVEGQPRPLPTPFLVAATQNPVEYEGTYPLPEAQLDRFLLKVTLPLPPREDEVSVLRRHASGFDPRRLSTAGIRPVAGRTDLEAGAEAVRRVEVSPEIAGYIVDIARATRTSPSISLGVSPRGATALLATSRAWAWLNGRWFVTPDDVKALAHATLEHRLALRPEAELEGVSVAAVLDSALASVPVPR
ncbi:AAA family ATPase [Terrabacter sp. 2RAF25]|uniref:AAA family ATPase n=1 Tax=Terrabacter sp. 2RAF25 TaxID=3232998 RepID=UPI003F9D33FC